MGLDFGHKWGQESSWAAVCRLKPAMPLDLMGDRAVETRYIHTIASVSRIDDVAPVPRLPLHDDDSMDLSICFKTPGSQGFELAQRSSLPFGG